MSSFSLSHTPPTSRLAGLDTLRATAITLVFMYHYMVFVSHVPTFGWASDVGWVGVDLFFVLSGYLISDQLLAGIVRGRSLSLGAFYARRALRTLPVFWLVLALYFLLPTVMGGRTPPPLWRFLSFTQNLGLQPGTAFSHAWSLCIEEQFYLVLPLVLIGARRFGTRSWQAWALLGGLIALGITARCVLWFSHALEAGNEVAGYHPNIYYATLCRFDEFLPGVAIALLKHLHPTRWASLMQHGRSLFTLALLSLAAALYGAHTHYYIEGYGYGFFMTGFGYSLIAMAFALCVLAALSPTSPLARIRVPGAAQLAMWSYAIYLTHKPVAWIVQGYCKRIGASDTTLLLAISLACVLVGYLVFRTVETPFMRLRARSAPTNFTVGSDDGITATPDTNLVARPASVGAPAR